MTVSESNTVVTNRPIEVVPVLWPLTLYLSYIYVFIYIYIIHSAHPTRMGSVRRDTGSTGTKLESFASRTLHYSTVLYWSRTMLNTTKCLCCMMESFCWPICCAANGSFLSSVCHPPETFHLIACTATAPPSTRTLGRYVRRKIDRRVLYMAMRIIRYTVHCPL